MKKSNHLTPGEYELMEILWLLQEGSVKEIWKRVDARRGLAYTTVMTVLEKMRRKGILRQRKEGKAFLYSPAIDRTQALHEVIEHITQTYFNGSRSDFVRFVSHDSPQQQESRADHSLSPQSEKTHAPGDNSRGQEESQMEEFLL